MRIFTILVLSFLFVFNQNLYADYKGVIGVPNSETWFSTGKSATTANPAPPQTNCVGKAGSTLTACFAAESAERIANDRRLRLEACVKAKKGDIVTYQGLEVTCIQEYLGSSDNDPEKICKDSYKAYGEELRDKEEKAEEKIEKRIEQIRDLEREALARKKDAKSTLESIDEEIAQTTDDFNDKMTELQKNLADSEIVGNDAIQDLIQNYQELASDIQKSAGPDQRNIISEYNTASQKYLDQCNLNAQEQIMQSIEARNKGVQTRASGAAPLKTVSSNFRTVGDFERIKKGVNAELQKCRAAKVSLEEQANIALEQLNVEITKKQTDQAAVRAKLELASKKVGDDQKRLATQIQLAGKSFQGKIQRLEQRKQTAQQEYLEEKALDDQRLAQLRTEQYSATPLLGTGSVFNNSGLTRSDSRVYAETLLEGVRDECCDMEKKVGLYDGTGFNSINQICKRKSRGRGAAPYGTH